MFFKRVILAGTKKAMAGSDTKLRKGYLTTTELAKLCGVSRFTIRNWIKQHKIKAIRTVGGQYRIPASEALSFLGTMHLKMSRMEENRTVPDSPGHCWEYPQKTNCDKKCKDCLIYGRDIDYCFIVVRQFGEDVICCKGDCFECDYFEEVFGSYSKTVLAEELGGKKGKGTIREKRNFVYNFAYSVGRGIHVLKERSKIK